jgi:hypothetical protein
MRAIAKFEGLCGNGSAVDVVPGKSLAVESESGWLSFPRRGIEEESAFISRLFEGSEARANSERSFW